MPIDLIDTIKPKNNGTFPMVEAEDVVVGKGTADEKRLPEALAEAGKVAAVDTTMPSSPADDHVPSTQLLAEQLALYLKLSGGTLTGNVSASGSVTISVPILEALNYFVARSLVNEAAYPYNHSIYLGYYNHDQCNFYEHGGVYNFRVGGSPSARIIGQITQNGIFELGTKLADKYAAKSHTHATAQVTGLDSTLAAKADAATTYTKDEVDQKITSALGDINAALAQI